MNSQTESLKEIDPLHPAPQLVIPNNSQKMNAGRFELKEGLQSLIEIFGCGGAVIKEIARMDDSINSLADGNLNYARKCR